MKASTYTQCLKKINVFCSLCKKGFIVAEINDLITKDELIEDIKKTKKISVFDLNMLSEREGRTGNWNRDADIFLIDEVACADVEKIVINLNYNRDWFSKLNNIVIFILPTITVNRLIEYSYSFWSFVNLHVIFITQFPPFIKPHFISDLLSYENDEYQSVDKAIYKDVYGTTKSAASLISNYNTTLYSNRGNDLNKILSNRFNGIDFSDVNSVEAGFASINSLGKKLLRESHFKEALKCFEFILKHFTLGADHKQTDIELNKKLIYLYYQLGDYLTALMLINNMLLIISDEDQLKSEYAFLSLYDLAALWNNAGVLLYLRGEHKQALSMYNKAAKLINNIQITYHLGEILFNLSLVSMVIGDYKNSQYYIDQAIEMAELFSNRSMRILNSRYNVLKAYLLVTMGAICEANDLIRPNLRVLRSEIVENHEFIMEAHFVYALIYLHHRELEKAKKCALKAYNIARKIRSPLRDRARIYQLLGEILFYMEDYEDARRYLYHACKQENVFSSEVLAWMNNLRNECDKMLAH